MTDAATPDPRPTHRKRPVEIEAHQLTDYPGDNAGELATWCGGRSVWGRAVKDHGHLPTVIIPTLEGDMRAEPGDWIIKGTRGEFYPCKPGPFEDTFEPLGGVLPSNDNELAAVKQQASEMAANLGDYQAKMRRVWALLHDTDGNPLPGESFQGLVGEMFAALSEHSNDNSPTQCGEPSATPGWAQCDREPGHAWPHTWPLIPPPLAGRSNDEPTIVDVVRILHQTYTDQGVLIWLSSGNRQLPSTQSPAAMIQDGRIAEVYEVALRIEGGH